MYNSIITDTFYFPALPWRLYKLIIQMPIPKRIPFFDDLYSLPLLLLSIDFIYTIGGGSSVSFLLREKLKQRNDRGLNNYVYDYFYREKNVISENKDSNKD